MIYFVNGTYNAYNTPIEETTMRVAHHLKSAGTQATVLLMKPDEETFTLLQRDQMTAYSLMLTDWLQDVAKDFHGNAAPSFSTYRSERSSGEMRYYDENSLVAVQTGEVVKYYDADKRILERDYYDPRGFLSRLAQFDDEAYMTTQTWLSTEGIPALTVAYDGKNQAELFTVPAWPGVFQSASALWCAWLKRIVKAGDIVVSMRREYDEAILTLPASIIKVAAVYNKAPDHPEQFAALIKDFDEDWLNFLKRG